MNVLLVGSDTREDLSDAKNFGGTQAVGGQRSDTIMILHVDPKEKKAAILSIQYGLAPGGLALLLEDDERFSLDLQRFLADHHVPYSLPLYDDSGRYLFVAPEKVEVLARGLLRAIGRGRDNELFVILADLLELSHELEPLLRAVKVALARHHQVMVICPWSLVNSVLAKDK